MDASMLLAQREMGQFPISIATSLALEGAAGILEEAPVSPAPIVSYSPKEIWFNLRTLFRNLYGSVERSVRDNITAGPAYDTLLNELEAIVSAVGTISNHKAKPVLYYSTLNSMVREFPYAKLKEAKTDLQKQYAFIEREVCVAIVKELGEETVRVFDVHLKGNHPTAFMVTHTPVDLLSDRFFQRLWLLESHTGAVKPKTQWSTKLTGSKGYEKIPFNRFTLQIFGDDSTYFYSQSIKYKRFLIDLAEKKHWHSNTTKSKILHDIERAREPIMLQIARDLFSTNFR